MYRYTYTARLADTEVRRAKKDDEGKIEVLKKYDA
jgi:hypothetical protein